MKTTHFALAFIFISSSLIAHNETSYDEAHATATINLSDEFPPAFPSSATRELIVRTVQPDQHSRGQHGIYYPETFPNVEKILFWKGSLENIDFESLAQLPALREILFDGVSFSDDQIQLLAPLQHKENLSLVFYDEGGVFYGDAYYMEVRKSKQQLLIIQQLLPSATIKFYSRKVFNENMFSL